MRRRGFTSIACAGLAGLTLVVAPSATAERERHKITMEWDAVAANINNAGPFKTQQDKFITHGEPFGKGPLITKTEAKDRGGEKLYPEFTGTSDDGKYKGSLDLKRTYLKTTTTKQRVLYNGDGEIDGGTGKYKKATGALKLVDGIITCYKNGTCEGTLTIEGWVKY